MSRLTKLFFLTMALAAPCAHADLEHAASDPAKPAAAADVDDYYVGIGLFSDMLNLNVETVTPWGNFMVRAGAFDDVEAIGVNLSWRRPLEGDDGHASGYYIGLFGGQITGEQINDDDELRLGAGVEMGRHWVSDYTRAELTVGLGAAEPIEEGSVKRSAEPTLFFSFNWALGY